jgi:hypothetical protein
MNELDISIESLNNNRLSESNLNKSGYTDKYFDQEAKDISPDRQEDKK